MNCCAELIVPKLTRAELRLPAYAKPNQFSLSNKIVNKKADKATISKYYPNSVVVDGFIVNDPSSC